VITANLSPAAFMAFKLLMVVVFIVGVKPQ
jgi:hypothetical protein